MSEVLKIQAQEHSQTESWLESFVEVYQQLSINNLNLLEKIYHQDVVFIDPLHHIQGVDKLTQYFSGLYTNLLYCQFEIEEVIEQNQQAAIYWKMSYQHPKLNKGKVITVQGHSHLKGQGDKVIYHRDYLDAGAMLYEHVPVFGAIVRWFKTRAIG